MITEYTHFGLIFTAQDVLNAQTHRDEAPYKTAWEQFESIASDAAVQANIHQRTLYNALRWRVLGDVQAGEAALIDFPVAWSDQNAAVSLPTFGLIQAYESLRDHPAHRSALTALIHDALPHFAHAETDDTVTRAWKNALQMAVGVTLENSALIESAVYDVKTIIESIHPAGYIPSVIQARPDDPQNFSDTVQTVHALTLAAEVGAHIGIDLWTHEKRTVSLMTAAFYPLYYYYYPEKWKWAEGLLMMDSQPVIQAAAGYLELVNRRRQNVRAVNLILNDIRPILSLNGGATTLTHHPAPPPKRRGWFR